MAQARILLWNDAMGHQVITLTAPHGVIAAQVVSWIAIRHDIPIVRIQVSRNSNMWYQGADIYSRIILHPNDSILPQDSLEWRAFDA